MAKNTSKKIKQLRGEKPEKISNDHLNKMQNIINNINRAQLDIGILETRKHNILHGLAGLNDELAVLQTEIKKEYGTTDINIKDGTINYEKNEQAN
tara:strand:- start:330 stop:617 length:288 start_codon:yes stop_codon:yes gene_type:complete